MKTSFAPAFTLTELLVVLTMLSLVVALVSAGAPKMFERTALSQARTRLLADLDMAAMRARSDAAFGVVEGLDEGRRYAISLNGARLITRTLPGDVRLRLSPESIAIDAAGRLAAGEFALEGETRVETLVVDPLTGRARGASDGAHRSPRRRRYPIRHVGALSQRAARSARRSLKNTERRATGSHRDAGACRGPGGLAVFGSAFRPDCAAFLARFLPSRGRTCSPAGAGSVRGDRRGTGRRSFHMVKRLCAHTASFQPAMTLMELLVALSILGLIAGITFASLGPWLQETRRAGAEAAFWRNVTPTQLLMSELSAGAVDLADTLEISPQQTRFTAYVPRLAPGPTPVVLRIESNGVRSDLTLETTFGRSTLLSEAPPLRFRPLARPGDDLVVEAQIRGAWAPLITAPFRSNAPLQCDFDLISRACR